MVTPERQEIATVQRDITQPVFGGVLRPQDDTLISRGQGHGLKIYDDIERDCHAYAVLQKRKMAVVSREWGVEPASSRLRDRKAADLVTAQIKAMSFDRVCLDLLDAILKGYSVGEVMWELVGAEYVATDIRARDQRRFAFDLSGLPRLLTWEAMVEGIPVPERKFVVHRFGSRSGGPYGLGLGTRLFWPVFFKRQGVTFWLTYADRFFNPTSVGKYPLGASAEDKRTLKAALDAMATDTSVVVPASMAIELLETKSSSTSNTHEALARWLDEQISEAVLGETLSTNLGGGGGSLAASRTHNEVRKELTKADADLLSGTLNATLVRWIAEVNLPGASPPRLWWDCAEPEDLNTRADRDAKIFSMGFSPSPEYIANTYGEGWTPRVPPQASTVPTPIGGETSFSDPPRDGTDDLVDQLDGLAAPAVDAMVAKVRELVMSPDVTSLQDVADRLIDLYPDIESAPLAELMGQALIVAELSGRAELTNAR